MYKFRKFVLIFIAIFFWTCSEELPNTPIGGGTVGNSNETWLIPKDEVRDGGPGKDGIPAINNPNFSPLAQVDFQDPEDLVIALATETGVRAYPHEILDWHEIVNEILPDGANLSLTYCPLTGTAIAWNGNINGQKTTFGVSGLLYNSNLMPYDRATDSYWSQMSHICVKGDLIGTAIETFPIVEMEFNTLRELYPQAMVLNTNTGFNRNYGRYPYGNYKTNNNNLIFPVNNSDERVPLKERVLGVVVNEQVMTYRFSSFEAATINLVAHNFQGKDLLVIGSTEKNFLTAFENKLPDGSQLTFEVVQNALPIVLQDNEGNKWDVFGKAIEGPRKGTVLPPVLNYIGYWFSWAAFNATLEIYE